jgi:hypothetical protein
MTVPGCAELVHGLACSEDQPGRQPGVDRGDATFRRFNLPRQVGALAAQGEDCKCVWHRHVTDLCIGRLPMADRHTAAQWREKAATARARADEIADPISKRMMFEIANGYDALAAHEESLAGARQALGVERRKSR